MASNTRISTDGLEAEIQRLNSLELKARAEALHDVVLAGAAAAEEIWRSEIERLGHISSRGTSGSHMIDAVGHTEPEANAYGISCEVYPLGEDDRGVRQRAKAGYIEGKRKATKGGIYGHHKTADKRFKGTQGRKFVDNKGGINDMAKEPVLNAMKNKINEILGE